MEKPSLLHRLLHAFDAPEPPPLPAPDEKLALGALMVRVAMSDHSYKFAEVHQIDLLLSRLFGLGPIEAAKMRATSERLERDAPDTEEFGDILRKTVSFAARVDALEALWEVTLSDGVRREEELEVLEDVRQTLGLSPDDSDAARARAETELGGSQ